MSALVLPVTILQGDDDAIVPPSVAASYCAAFPRTRLVSLANCGHFDLMDPATEAWEIVLRELRTLG
ncbi:hypothetical protein H8K52_11200 [Undibacterium seohonense]|uniref:AB hydrolase-1 domain-containing protein n=1 Tax=Undibacterium seohonense TaxID=1344950 RepID=A0ABR6X543_9BURK|nr:alpha/beta fold hydrolase [Undibacterium seohonense]MBC3807911.1 hypothetical protein [Undibacterium seohonense]